MSNTMSIGYLTIIYNLNLQLICTFEYNTLYKKIKTCYVTKVVCNMYKLLYTLLHDMLYSCLENQFNTYHNSLNVLHKTHTH